MKAAEVSLVLALACPRASAERGALASVETTIQDIFARPNLADGRQHIRNALPYCNDFIQRMRRGDRATQEQTFGRCLDVFLELEQYEQAAQIGELARGDGKLCRGHDVAMKLSCENQKQLRALATPMLQVVFQSDADDGKAADIARSVPLRTHWWRDGAHFPLPCNAEYTIQPSELHFDADNKTIKDVFLPASVCPKQPETHRVLWATSIAAGAALVPGVAYWVISRNKGDESDKHCGIDGPPLECDATGIRLDRDARDAKWKSLSWFGVASVIFGAGLTYDLLSSSADEASERGTAARVHVGSTALTVDLAGEW